MNDCIKRAPVAQLDRASDYGSEGYGFESFRARLNGKWLSLVEHLVWDQGVAGSNPVFPTSKNRGLSSAGRAPALHAGGQRFDPARLHHFYFVP